MDAEREALVVDFETGSTLPGNPAEWRLLRSEAGAWTGVDSFELVRALDRIPVGDRREFTLWLFEGDPVPCDSGVEVGDVEPGRYAFSVGWGPDERVCATLVEVGDVGDRRD